jgi:hypothetical protein
MILKKDSILYHTSEIKLINLKEKPFLFCSFHPSDYESYNSKYINIIKLKKDVKLFFMIGNITNIRINILMKIIKF